MNHMCKKNNFHTKVLIIYFKNYLNILFKKLIYFNEQFHRKQYLFQEISFCVKFLLGYFLKATYFFHTFENTNFTQ